MRKLRAILLRLRGLFGSRHTDDDFAAELESHIELHTEAGLRAGLNPAEARRQALIRLGGVEQARQAHRERRGLPSLESLLRDVVYGVRTLAKHRGATAIAILSIGLGIGANTTIFSMVNRFLLRPAPMGDPSALLALHTVQDGDRCCNPFSWPLYSELHDHARSFSGVAAYYELIPASIRGNGEPERVWGQAVTSNFFAVTQLPMVVGRGFVNGEDRQPEIVLSARLWHRRFNGDAQIIGRSVSISGRAFIVVGVVTPAFHGADQILNTEFWVPIGALPQLVPNLPAQNSPDFHWIEVLARLAPGASKSDAGAELKTILSRYAAANPKTEKGTSIVFEEAGTIPSAIRANVSLFLASLTVVALLVLSIAGANVANVLFAQAASRQRDMAVRLALGATRARLRRQLLIESLLLSSAGAALGVLLSLWATRGLSTLHVPVPVPLDVSIAVDWRVLLYSFGLSVVSGLLLGAAPAWAASRPLLARALKGEDALARPGRGISLRRLLVVSQIAMSVVLLCVTGLFLRSLQTAATIDIGFRSTNLLMMSVDPRVQGYSAERTVEFLTQLQQRIAKLPGVRSVVTTDVPPLNGGHRSDGFNVVGGVSKAKSLSFAELYMVTPGYFDTLGIPLFAGRDFGHEASGEIQSAIVNRAFVDRVFAGTNAIGQRVVGGGITYQIVGVVGNVKSRTLGEDQRPAVYRPLQQAIGRDPSLLGYTIVVRTMGNPAALTESMRQQIYALDPAMAVFNEETMEEHVRTAFFLPRLAAMLFGTFGFIGLVLASVGLYGVMSYTVSRRTREIGIRMAMGAKPGSVERLMLREGMVLALIALALGWPAAWMLSKLAAGFLYGIQPHDLFTFTIVPPFLAVIALIACYIPARRAASIDPMQALRTE